MGRPAVPEESNGANDCADEHEGDAVFGGSFVVFALTIFAFYVFVDFVVQGAADLGCEEIADCDDDEVEAGYADGFVVAVLP